MSPSLELSTQFVDDYREIERKVVELAGQIDNLEDERDRLKRENLRLRENLQLWKGRYHDLFRE
jgi:FtsZ-binding cell division protein ZapB